MKSTLELFKTDEVIERIIEGKAGPRDFRLFQEIFSTSKISNSYKDGILYSLKDVMSHKSFHQLVGGLLAEDKAFVSGKIPDGASLAGKVIRIEAKMHQGDLKKDDPNIQQSLNVILSHYPPDKVNNALIHSAVEKIYAPLIINANPHEASKSEFESYYYDSSSIGSDYGPTQEDMDRLHLEQYREEKEHENKVLGLIDKAYNLSIAKENKSLINGKLELNNKSRGSLEDFKQRCESSKKLPKEVSDPLERRAIKAVDEEIIPQINKLANSKSKNYDINSFIERIDKALVLAGVSDFDKQSAAEKLKESYLEAAKLSNVSTRHKFLYSLGEIFKQSRSSLVNKLGDHCHNKIDEDSVKILVNNKNLKRKTGEVLANALNTTGIAKSMRERLENLEDAKAVTSHIVPNLRSPKKSKSQIR